MNNYYLKFEVHMAANAVFDGIYCGRSVLWFAGTCCLYLQGSR